MVVEVRSGALVAAGLAMVACGHLGFDTVGAVNDASGSDGVGGCSVDTAATLLVSGFPASINSGSTGTFTVTARDACGGTATGYTGTVHFTSNDGAAVLPANYTFVGGDNGLHAFQATLNTVTATASLAATDTSTGTITGTQSPIDVTTVGSSLTVDTTSSGPAGGGAAASITWSHTVGACLTNSILLVGVSIPTGSGAVDASTVTFNGVSLTKRVGAGASNQNEASIWYLLNPPAGTHTILVTLGGTTSGKGPTAGGITLSHVDQANPLPTMAGNFGNGMPSVSITTQYANSWTVDALAYDSGSGEGAPTGTGETQRWGVCASDACSYGSSIATSTVGPHTMSWPQSDNWAQVVVEVKFN
jgi:hypothetical protein